MSFEKRGLRESDVIISKLQSVNGTVTVPVDATLEIGTLLISADGGITWTERQEADWIAGSYAVDDVFYHLGHIWKSLAATNVVEPGTDPAKWEDQGLWGTNGVLVEGLELTAPANVLTMGSVVENNLTGFEAALLPQLFDRKIILK